MNDDLKVLCHWKTTRHCFNCFIDILDMRIFLSLGNFKNNNHLKKICLIVEDWYRKSTFGTQFIVFVSSSENNAIVYYHNSSSGMVSCVELICVCVSVWKGGWYSDLKIFFLLVIKSNTWNIQSILKIIRISSSLNWRFNDNFYYQL